MGQNIHACKIGKETVGVNISKHIKRATFIASIAIIVGMLLVLFLVSIVKTSMPGEESGAYVVRKSISGHISKGSLVVVRVKDKDGGEHTSILRVIGKAGETISVNGGYTFANGIAVQEKSDVRSSFIISRDASYKTLHLMERVCGEAEVGDTVSMPIMKIKPEWKRYLRTPVLKNMPDERIYPYDKKVHWNAYNIGPLAIPKAGEAIKLTEKNRTIYGPLMKDVKADAESYTFSEDYIWAMCDDRDICDDSRTMGPIAVSEIEGIVEMKLW